MWNNEKKIKNYFSFLCIKHIVYIISSLYDHMLISSSGDNFVGLKNNFAVSGFLKKHLILKSQISLNIYVF